MNVVALAKSREPGVHGSAAQDIAHTNGPVTILFLDLDSEWSEKLTHLLLAEKAAQQS